MRTLLLSTIIISFAVTANSQVFWSEDFSNGIPADWSNEDLSEIGLLWTYCADTSTYANNQDTITCPFDLTDCDNRQNHFKSNSPENGFACCVADVFFDELGSTTFDSRLTTSAIDCSNQSEVYILFNSHIGVFDLNALDHAFLQVSTDRVTWTQFTPFPDLQVSQTTEEGFRRWSFNPQQSTFDISDIAANQETVYLQWYWEGNREYHWSIDDIVLTSENPFPSVDVSLSPDIRFHALMPNFSTPLSQIEPAHFLTDVVQFGLDTLRDLEVIATISNVDGTNTLYEESVFIDELAPNLNHFDITFPPYIHEGGIGEFKLTYSSSDDLDDGNTNDNAFEYPFEITQNLLKKHRDTEITKNVFPTGLDQNNFIISNWDIANHFHIPNGAGMSVDEVFFEIPNRFQMNDFGITYVINDPDIVIDVTLYEWDNLNSDDFATPNEYTPVGSEVFTVTGGDGNSPNRIKLENLISIDENIPLKDDQDYILALEYRSTTNPTKLFAVKASISLNYDATIQSNILQNQLRFGAMTRIGDTDVFDSFAFGGNVIPNLWMSVTENTTATSTTVLPPNAINVFPNPAKELTRVTFDFELEPNASLELLDINGRSIKRISIANNQAEINCADLANGTYLLKYSSGKSSGLQKLIVMH